MQNKQSLNITECGILNVVTRYQFSKKTMLLLMTWCMLSMSSLQSIAAEKIKVEKILRSLVLSWELVDLFIHRVRWGKAYR